MGQLKKTFLFLFGLFITVVMPCTRTFTSESIELVKMGDNWISKLDNLSGGGMQLILISA